MLKKFKKNWIFILLVFLYVAVILGAKDYELTMDVVTYPDTELKFDFADESLEQTWLSEVKEINGINIAVRADHTFTTEIELNVLDGNTRTVLRSTSQNIQFQDGDPEMISFKFPTIRRCQGNQYIIQMRWKPESAADKIYIAAGTNYSGCSIKGEEQSLGAAFQISFLKNSRIYWLLISFFPFIAFSLFFMIVFHKKWEECIGLSTGLFLFILFVFGLFNNLEKGIYFNYILALLLFVVSIAFYNKKNMSVSDLGSYGVILYGLTILFILINCKDARFAKWDEFSHWGLAVKDMFYSNSFAKHVDSSVMIQYYPPVTTLMEYFFCYTNKLFSESTTYVGFQVLNLNLLITGLEICKNRKLRTYLFTYFSLLLFPLIIYKDVYNCIYADPMLAFGAAYVLICYFIHKLDGFNLSRIAAGLFVLTLTKDIGVVYAGLLTLIMLGDIFIKQCYNKKIKVKKIIIGILGIGLVCGLFISWQYYLSIPTERVTHNVQSENGEINYADEQENMDETGAVTGAIGTSGITLEGIKELVSGDAPEYRYETIKNYIAEVFSANNYSFGPIGIAYMDFMMILLTVCILLGLNYRNEKGIGIISFGIFSFIANIGYCVFLLVTYIFAFAKSEATGLHSINRYLGSYLCGVGIAFIIILIGQTVDWRQQKRQIIMGIMALLLFVSTPFEAFIIKNKDTIVMDEYVYGYEDLADILRTEAKKGDRVYFICNNSSGLAELQFKTVAIPLITDYPQANMYASEQLYEKQMKLYGESSTTPYFVSVKEWEKKLYDYDYVVLFHPNEVFREAYAPLFENPDSIDDGTVYKVRKSGNSIELKLIGKTGVLLYL